MTVTLNLKQPYGVIYGHPTAQYEQNGQLFNSQYRLVSPPVEKEISIAGLLGDRPTDPLESAKAFLLNVLKENPLSKSVIYKEVENNNQSWDKVRDAALSLGVIKYSQKNLEFWKLPEGVTA